jgi:ATP-dependent Lon protease
MDELGLFPLAVVLLPFERIPLHIFEDRYKELIGQCIEDDSEFGLIYADSAGVREIGTRARVSEVLNRFEDGRLNVLVEGGERFRLEELTDGRSFHTGLISALDDEDDPADEASIEEALRVFGKLRELTGSDVEVPTEGTHQISYVLAGKVELASDDKLALLGDRSERARLERVQELLDEAVITAQRVQRAAKRAATNGRVELG